MNQPSLAKRNACVGCADNFYNGNNALGVSECWKLKDMKIIWRKAVPMDQRPPWNQPAERKPDCYRRKGYAYINGKDRTGW